MSRVDESNLLLEIESINDYIDNFELERKSGTKALKKKFHKEAVEGRNAYVKDKIDLYEEQQVKEEVAREFAEKNKIKFRATSALTEPLEIGRAHV